MAEALWARHAGVLSSGRVQPSAVAARSIGARQALRMLFGFLSATLRNAPAAWYARVINSVSSSVAGRVHTIVFGEVPVAYQVMVNGVTSSGVPASWEDTAAAARQIDDALTVPGERREHEARADLAPLWRDYAAAAMTLCDGGQRDPALAPVQVGSSRGVLRSPADCVPGPEVEFQDHSGAVTAVSGPGTLHPVDVLGAFTLRRRLQVAAADAGSSVEAERSAQALGVWQAERSRSFGVQVGSTLGRRFVAVGKEVRDLLLTLEQLGEDVTPDQGSLARQRRLARLLRVFLLVAVVALVVLVALGGLDLLSWTRVAIAAGVTVVVWFVGTLLLFLSQQRELFRELNRRQDAQGRVEATRTNLRLALRDQRRLALAYEQFLEWSSVLGTFLAQPFGRGAVTEDTEDVRVVGLPASTRLATATVDAHAVSAAVMVGRRENFAAGWLSAPFEALLLDAPDRIGPQAHELAGDIDGVYGLSSDPQEALLQRWAASVRQDGVGVRGQDELRRRVLGQLQVDDSGVRDALARDVLPADGATTVARDEFMAGVDVRVPSQEERPFDGVLLTAEGQVGGHHGVSETFVDEVVDGLGSQVVVVQLGHGRQEYEYVISHGQVGDVAPAEESPWSPGTVF